MTVRYVDGSAGNNSWDGLAKNFVSGSNGPKLSLNGAEDTPVVAGDLVHVRTVDANGVPIVYRELLTCDVSGTAGNPIEFRADVAGIIWPVGGICRITGSDNDTTATRNNCISATSRNYRTFTGFHFDTTISTVIALNTSCSNWIVQDCHFANNGANVNNLHIAGTGTANTIRRCLFRSTRGSSIFLTHTSVVDNSGHVVENCIFQSTVTAGVRSERIGGITVRNCVFDGGSTGVRVSIALTAGQTTTVNNCIFMAFATSALQSVTAPGTNEEITENYNTFWGNIADRTNVSTGANSVAYPPLYNPATLLSGFRLPQLPLYGLSEWSPLRAITGTGTAADDFYGVTRPATAAKLSWGALQHAKLSREVTTVRTGSASLKLADAGVHQIYVQTTAVSTVFSVYVQWEADYAGTLPSLTIKQPGQSDVTVTATGSSGSWELLTTTLTPAASPGYIIAELRSSNTAAPGNVDVFWDDLVCQPA